MKYCNEHPTITEKTLFERYGLYLVYKDEDVYKYAPIHIPNQYQYPSCIEVEDDMIEREHVVIFDISTETVKLNDFYDVTWIELIQNRMKELNWR